MIAHEGFVVPASKVQVQLWKGQIREGRVVASGGGIDPALLTVSPGEFVIAAGNPFGFMGAVTTGAVTRIGSVRGLGDTAYVQTAIRLAPGNSGGPLANTAGEINGG